MIRSKHNYLKKINDQEQILLSEWAIEKQNLFRLRELQEQIDAKKIQLERFEREVDLENLVRVQKIEIPKLEEELNFVEEKLREGKMAELSVRGKKSKEERRRREELRGEE